MQWHHCSLQASGAAGGTAHTTPGSPHVSGSHTSAGHTQIKHAKIARELESVSLSERALGERVEELEQEVRDVSSTCRWVSRQG
jgi:hypothetical protein